MGGAVCCREIKASWLPNELFFKEEKKINTKEKNNFHQSSIFIANSSIKDYSKTITNSNYYPNKKYPVCSFTKKLYPTPKLELLEEETIRKFGDKDWSKEEKLEKAVKNEKSNSEEKEEPIINQNLYFDDIQLEEKENDFSPKMIDSLYLKCSDFGKIEHDDNFSLDDWKKLYNSDERFFKWDKGNVKQNQKIIKNKDDPFNLQIYEGDVNENNEKHGFGILTTPQYIRKGMWRNNQFTGWGRESRLNGDVYEGKFINGFINGKGIFTNKKGNKYIGDLVNNRRDGKGDLTTNKFHYIGDFKDNRLEGNGKIVFLKENHSYEGEFANNEINGKGIFIWNNGDIYEGQMKNGRMNGFGKYTYKDGKIYEGNYINGFKEGKGKYIYKNGVEFEGTFTKGNPIGEGILKKDGKSVLGIYENGKFKPKKI